MRYLDGTPQEIAEFLRLTEAAEPTADTDPTEPGGGAVAAATTVGGSAWEEIEGFVRGRGRDEQVIDRVLTYLRAALALGNVEVGPGTSERTRDGLTDYVMVRDAGKRRFGAVAYVQATNGGLTLRLTKEDVADLHDEHIGIRDVKPGHRYVVTCALFDDDASSVALTLTARALAKVR